MADFISKISIGEGYDGGMTITFEQAGGIEVVSYQAFDPNEAIDLIARTLPQDLQQALNAQGCIISRDIAFESSGCFSNLAYDYSEDDVAIMFCDIYIGNVTGHVLNFAEAVGQSFPPEDIPVDNIAFKGGSWGLCLDIHGLSEGNIFYNAQSPSEAVDLFRDLGEVLANDLTNAGMYLGDDFYIRYEDGFSDLEMSCSNDMVANAFIDMYNDGYSDDAEFIGRQVAALML